MTKPGKIYCQCAWWEKPFIHLMFRIRLGKNWRDRWPMI